jgi:hypothetical protein
LPYLELFAEEHRIAMISVDQVAEHRSAKVERVGASAASRPLLL